MAYFSGVECDKCENTFAYGQLFAKRYLNKWAREKGWSIGKKCLCPKCKLQKKKSS